LVSPAGAYESRLTGKESYQGEKREMRTVLLVVMLVGLLGAALVTPSGAQVNVAEIAQLEPFSPEANYMSLPGYLRWQIFKEEGRWISRLEAVREIKRAGGDPTVTYKDTIVLRRLAGEAGQ